MKKMTKALQDAATVGDQVKVFLDGNPVGRVTAETAARVTVEFAGGTVAAITRRAILAVNGKSVRS